VFAASDDKEDDKEEEMVNHSNAVETGEEGPGSPVRRRRPDRVRNVLALVTFGALAALLAACGSSSSASTTSTTAGSSAKGPGGSGSPRQFPGASGTIAAVNGTSVEVQNPESGQTTVTYTPSTTFHQIVPASVTSVAVGSCISAFGKPTSGTSSSSGAFGEPVTATTVSVTQPVSGSCSAGAGGFGGGRFPGGGRPPSGGSSTNGSGTRPPAAGRFRNGQFGAASGSVTAVNGSSVTVDETNPRTQKTSSVVVTLTSSTTYSATQSSSPSALVVGQCARAMGTANSTGAITAQSITVSAPGANGCTTGFGGFRGGTGAGRGGAVTTGA
jgi:Domain of unknown function (DUF5666)